MKNNIKNNEFHIDLLLISKIFVLDNNIENCSKFNLIRNKTEII